MIETKRPETQAMNFRSFQKKNLNCFNHTIFFTKRVGDKPVGFRVRRGDKELYVRSGILDTILYRTGVKAPLGRWFNLTGRFVIADSGLVEMWLDGQKIASIRTDTKDNDHAYPGVGNYIDSIDYPVTCHIYIDDVKVTY